MKANRFMWIVVSLSLGMSVVQYARARDWPESQTATAYSKGALIPYQPLGGSMRTTSICRGNTTVLEVRQILAKIPQHDVDRGRTEFILSTQSGNKILIQETFNEVWECWGFNPRTRKFLLISKNESGVKVSLRGLVYLDETHASFQDSVFVKCHFSAAAALLTSDGKYLALIGIGQTEDRYALYVLNTEEDQMLKLGPAPAPPPLTPSDLEYPDAQDFLGPWEAPERHYTELETGIWGFVQPHVLQVSYGHDTVTRRAKRRTLKTWNLERVFEATPPRLHRDK